MCRSVLQTAHAGRDSAAFVEISKLLLQRIVETHPLHLAGRRKIAQHAVERFGFEEIVEHDVRERLGVDVSVAKCARVEVEFDHWL